MSILWRGAQMWAINIDTGELVWKVNGMYRHPMVVDGICVALNSYDGQVYAFGTGPSATTVSAPQTAVARGSAVMITGTVTDQTPASMGTPAISDADMGAWMEYLHMQKVMPQDATGVPVRLTIVDPSGVSTNIATTTSDISGNFGYAYTPNAEGTYKVIASFDGSASYGGSFSTAYFVVGPAAAAPQPTSTPQPTVAPTTAPPTATPTPTASPSVVPEPEATPSTDIYIIAAAAAVIIVVVAVAAVFLRKRK